MRRIILYICLFLPNIIILSKAQSLTIEDCMRMARETYPLIQQYGIIDKIGEYTIENANKAWLPKPTLLVGGTYVSQVSTWDINLPSANIMGIGWGTIDGKKSLGTFHYNSSQIKIPQAHNFQYDAGLKVEQIIWDGGQIKAIKKQVKAESAVKRNQLDLTFHDLDRKVSQVFLAVLLARQQLELNANMQNDINRNYQTVKTAYDNGLVTHADLDAVMVEKLNLEKQQEQVKAVQQQYIHVLGIMIGSQNELSPSCLVMPDAEALETSLRNASISNMRHPQLLLLDAQKSLLDARQKHDNTILRPRLGFFVAGGMGNPGLNIFNNTLKTFFLTGIKLSWKLDGFYTHKNENKIYELNRRELAVEKDAFIFNSKMEESRNNSDIEKCKNILTKDREIVELRSNIKRASESKMRNGTITVTELMRDITAEMQARQEIVLQEIKLLKTLFEQKYTVE